MQKMGYMKTLGRRREPQPTFANMDAIQRLLLEMHGKRSFLPRGVYRFPSHEEADAWQMRMLTR